MSWLITVAADWSPQGLHLPWDALSSLSQPAWLFFPLFFSSFFFFFFFLPLLTQSNVSHIFFYACHLSCIPVCCPIPQHAGCMALMPLDVLVCGPPPGSERAQQRNFVSPARALFRDNNNSRRKVSCEERSNRRGNTGLRGKPRRC